MNMWEYMDAHPVVAIVGMILGYLAVYAVCETILKLLNARHVVELQRLADKEDEP